MDEDNHSNNHPASDERSPSGGEKDTNTRTDIKDVQRQDMLDKGEEVEHTPKDVTGEHDAMQPMNQRR